MLRSTLILIGWLALCLGAGLLGSLFPPDAWFVGLNKPAFQPPDWLFAPVWTTLYVFLAVAAWRVSSKPAGISRDRAIRLFLIQLALNAAWTPTFFGAHQIGAALLIQLTLDVFTVLCWRRFADMDRWSGMLLVPYLLWLAFATVLGVALFWLN